MGSPVSLMFHLKSSEEHVFIQVLGGNNSWINFWDFSCFSQHVFPFPIYWINELVKGPNSLTHRCFPTEAGNLGIAMAFVIREEGCDQKEGPSWGLHGGIRAWEAKQHHPTGCQWPKPPEVGGSLAIGHGVLLKYCDSESWQDLSPSLFRHMGPSPAGYERSCSRACSSGGWTLISICTLLVFGGWRCSGTRGEGFGMTQLPPWWQEKSLGSQEHE